MSYAMFGKPYQTYDLGGGRKYISDSAGKIPDVADSNDRKALRDSGCLDEGPIIATSSVDNLGAVLSVAGRTGAVTLSHSDVSGLGSAALSATTDFDAAGAASTAVGIAQAAAEAASDPVGSAAAAQAAAEAYADAGDAATIDVPLTTVDATANVVAATYTPAHNTLVHVEATFLARFQAGTDGKTHKVTAAFLTDNSGTVTIVGSSQGGDTHTTAGATTAAADVKTNGTLVQLVVTGIGSTNIDWRVIGDVTLGP